MEAIDALVLAKLAASPRRPSVSQLAQAFGLTNQELSDSLRRLEDARVYSNDGIEWSRTLEFFEHALRYLIPPRIGGARARGVRTGSFVPPIDDAFGAAADPWVWPSVGAMTEGRPIEPIDPRVVSLVEHDESLHVVLACADCFRVGDARERNSARRVLSALLRRNAALQRQLTA